jgi:molecular chaperone DnaK (HSP70)
MANNNNKSATDQHSPNRVFELGIDLGTAHTRTAVLRYGVEMVPHEDQLMMPSCVAFTETSRLVGLAASRQADTNPSNTITGALRFVGQDYRNANVQKMAAEMPFLVVNKGNRAAFLVEHGRRRKFITPIEVLAMILCKARMDAEKYLGEDSTVNGAIITVPAIFTFPQRQAVRDAARIARFRWSRVISTAVTICADYQLNRSYVSGYIKNILAIDLGAGFLDVAIADISSKIKIKTTGGKENVGGEYVNDGLMELSSSRIHYFDATYNKDPHQLHVLRRACEKAKCRLASETEAPVEAEDFYWPHSITREALSGVCSEVLVSLKSAIAKSLSEASLKPLDIRAVIVAGGTSRMPLVQAAIDQIFGEDKVWKGPMTKEAAARGAATLSTMLHKETARFAIESILVDVVPTSIGIHVPPDCSGNVFPKGTTIPSEMRVTLPCSSHELQPWHIELYEGEEDPTWHNTMIGAMHFTLKNFKKTSTYQPTSEVEVYIAYTADGDVVITGSNIEFVAEDEPHPAESVAVRYLSDHHTLPEEKFGIIARNVHSFEIEERGRVGKLATETSLHAAPNKIKDSSVRQIASDTEIVEGSHTVTTTKAPEDELVELKSPATTRDKTPSSQQGMRENANISESSPDMPPISPPVTLVTREEPAAREQTYRSTVLGITDIFAEKAATSSTFTDSELVIISNYLRNTGQLSWGTVPRLYSVLRVLNQLDMLDVFIQQGITDIWFPFSSTSLPSTLSPTMQARFLEQQARVLSKSLLFETSPERKHGYFAQDDPLPFQVVGKLGSGAHGHVDKVISTVSHREYARKQFRKRKGATKTTIKSFLVELQVLKRVQHIHCIELVSIRMRYKLRASHVDDSCRCTVTRIPNSLRCL